MFNRIIKFKNATISIGNLSTDQALLHEIEQFDLANSTPTDCMDFLRDLKSRYGNKGSRR